VRKKILTLSWLSGDRAALKSTLSNNVICTPELRAECERYQALEKISRPISGDEAEMAVDKARRATGEMRALWAAAACRAFIIWLFATAIS